MLYEVITFSGRYPVPADPDHRPQHGRQIHGTAPGGLNCSHGPDGFLCAGGRRLRLHHGSYIHPGGGPGQSFLRAELV